MSLPENPADATPAELLQTFSRTKSGEAFTELVRRYAGLVSGTAARVLGGREAAEDVAQEVFALLARKAPAVEPATLAGWLHRVAVRRAAAARRRREALARRDQAAFMNMEKVTGNAPDPQWVEVLPALDRALDSLPANDRAVVMLRYYEQLSWHEIAARLPLSADAARKRTVRAIERLGRTLKARGISTTAAALAAGLAAQWKADAAGAVSPSLAAQSLTKACNLSTGVVLTTTLATMSHARWAGFGAVAACLVAGSLALWPLLRSSEKEWPAKVAISVSNHIAAARPPSTGVPGSTPAARTALDNPPLNGAVEVFQENITPVNEARLVEIKVKPGDKVQPQTVVAVMDSSKDKLDLENLRRKIISERLKSIRAQEEKLLKLENELQELQLEDEEDSALITALESQIQSSEDRIPGSNRTPEILKKIENDPALLHVNSELARVRGRNALNTTQTAILSGAILSIGKIRDTLIMEKKMVTAYGLLNPEVTQSNALRDDESHKLKEINARLEHCEIRTRSGGIVDHIGRQIGELVKPGEGILKVIGDPRQIDCFLPQNHQSDIKVGDIVWVASTMDKPEIFETTVIGVSLRNDNLSDAASPRHSEGCDVVLDYPVRPVQGYPGGAIKDGRFLLQPGQTVTIHLSKPGAAM